MRHKAKVSPMDLAMAKYLIKEGYKWIARDTNRTLLAYSDKPVVSQNWKSFELDDPETKITNLEEFNDTLFDDVPTMKPIPLYIFTEDSSKLVATIPYSEHELLYSNIYSMTNKMRVEVIREFDNVKHKYRIRCVNRDFSTGVTLTAKFYIEDDDFTDLLLDHKYEYRNIHIRKDSIK